LLNIKPAFSFPAVEVLNDTIPWQLNVQDSADLEDDFGEDEGEEEARKSRGKRSTDSSLLASCGGTYRYSGVNYWWIEEN
jgi:hypothetical protein